MKLINFDEQFEQYAGQWMLENAAKYKNNVDRMEMQMPEVYIKWLNQPAPWLDGDTPGTYFARYGDADYLVKWMLAYYAGHVPVPDQLLERVTALGDAVEDTLVALLEDEGVPEEARLTAISMLGEMESQKPKDKYIRWILEREEKDERAELAAEALTAMGRAVVNDILEKIKTATPAGRETFLDILCNFPGEESIYRLAVSMFAENPERHALFASFLGKLGDERAIPILRGAMEEPGISYLDYIELRNAIEALGGEAPEDREFAGDPYYEALKLQL